MVENNLVFDQTLSFPCGCKFPYCVTVDGKKHVDLSLKWEDLIMDCPATFALLESGKTKGCFQVESNLGQQTCKSAPIEKIDDVANIITIMRPGGTEAFLEDGKNVTTHFLQRRSGKEPISYLSPALESHLNQTQGLMIYQEQTMSILKDIAGFTSSEADKARKGIGKKLQDIIAQIKVQFLSGSKELKKVSEAESTQIWSWIEACGRYQFNASHSYEYAYITYFTAYLKAHFEHQFFTAWLYYAGDKNKSKQKEIRELIRDAKKSNIEVSTPSFLYPEPEFSLMDDVIRFGICDIKEVGKSSYEQVTELRNKLIEDLGPIDTWTYLDHQFQLIPYLKSQIKNGLIKVGGFSYINKNRLETWYHADIISQLTPPLLKWCKENYHNYKSIPEVLIGLSQSKLTKPQREKTIKLIAALESPPCPLQDTIRSIADDERYYLGIALTCNTVDECDISSASHNVRDIYTMSMGTEKFFTVGVEIDEVKEYTIKNGKNVGQKMGILVISDNTCTMEGIAVFGKTWTENKNILVEGNTVMLGGKITNYRKSMVVEKIWQL